MKVKLKFDEEDIKKEEAGGGDFVTPKPGYYLLRVVGADAGFSKDPETGGEDKSRPRIKVTYAFEGEGVNGGELKGNYGQVWDYISMSEKAGRTRARYAKVFYPDDYESGSVDFDTDDILGKVVVAKIRVKAETYNGETRDRVSISGLWNQDQFEESSQSDDDDSDVFPSSGGDDDDAFDSDFTEADSGSSGYTESELKELDIKELGNVAKEFDIDPKEMVVKYKSGENSGKPNRAATSKAIIAAIMEAQNAADGGGEDDDDDDDLFA